MKITKLTTWRLPPRWMFLKIETDEGIVGWGEPIGCGGVAVFPNDIVVADQDGAVLIPQAQLDHVLAEGPEQERMEAWIVNEVNNGAVLPGLYPMNAETKARYAASKK